MVNTFFILYTVAVCVLYFSSCEPRVLDVYQSYPSSHDNQVEYDYRYAIDDGTRSGVVSDRWEQRIGEFVKGAYSLLEPNGKIRTVNYEVDGKRGFHATVKTTNPANVLLSNQQLEKYNRVHPEPYINLYTRKTSPPPIIRLYKDPLVVPPNYHAIMAEHAHSGASSMSTQINEQFKNGFENYYTSTSLQPPPSQLSRNNNQQKYRQLTSTYENRQRRYNPFF